MNIGHWTAWHRWHWWGSNPEIRDQCCNIAASALRSCRICSFEYIHPAVKYILWNFKCVAAQMKQRSMLPLAVGSDVFLHKILDFRFIQFKSKTQIGQRSMLPLAVMCFHTRPWFLLPFSLQWVSADKSRLIQGSPPSLPCPKTLGHRIGGCLVQQIEKQARTIWH